MRETGAEMPDLVVYREKRLQVTPLAYRIVRLPMGLRCCRVAGVMLIVGRTSCDHKHIADTVVALSGRTSPARTTALPQRKYFYSIVGRNNG